MKYYHTKSSSAAADLAARLADLEKARATFAIWTGDGRRQVFDRAGRLAETDDMPRHADAVEIWPAMDLDALKNAKRIATARETVRTVEDRAAAILDRGDDMTPADRAALLSCINVAYHDSGKIEGCNSVDSCASCDFCRAMIRAAENNILMICGACYAARDSYKEASWRRHSLNARILSRVLFTVEELNGLALDAARCRFNEDGDTVNETHARNLLRIAAGRPGIAFGYWFKNGAAVEAGLHAEGYHTRDALPDNVRFIHSSAIIGQDARPTWYDDAIFTVWPDAETTRQAILAGAHECNGRRCRACGYYCYTMQRQAAPVYIAEYLRTGEKQRAAILAAHNARLAAAR